MPGVGRDSIGLGKVQLTVVADTDDRVGAGTVMVLGAADADGAQRPRPVQAFAGWWQAAVSIASLGQDTTELSLRCVGSRV